MAPHPVRAANGTTWELLAVHEAGDGRPSADGHPTRHYRIYAGTVSSYGTLGVARADMDLTAAQHAKLLEEHG